MRARDPRWGGVYEADTAKWAGERFYKKQGSTTVLYYTGFGDEGAWVIGTTLGVRHIQNRIWAQLKGPAARLFDEAGSWEVRFVACPALVVASRECNVIMKKAFHQCMHAFSLAFGWLWLATRRDATVAALLGLFCRPRSSACMHLFPACLDVLTRWSHNSHAVFAKCASIQLGHTVSRVGQHATC